VPSSFRSASYANPSEFQIQQFRSEGYRRLRPRSHLGPCPLPNLAQSKEAHGERQHGKDS
jgi:hypothetical protein